MGAIITSGQTRYQVDKTFNKLWVKEQASRPKYYGPYFTAKDAEPGPSYKEGRIAELGLAGRITEGQRPALIVPAEGNSVERFYYKRGLSLQMTEERMDDDIRGTWQQLPGQLNDSIEEALEIDAANILYNADSTAVLGEDGARLVSAAGGHSLLNSSSVIINRQAAALSSTSLQAAIAYGQKSILKENGFLMPCKLKAIVIHPDDQWVANDLLKASGRVWDYDSGYMNKGVVTGGAANVVAPGGQPRNLLNPSNGAVDDWKIYVNPYLQGNTKWFALYEGYELSLVWKYRPRLTKDSDSAGTGNMIWTAKARYGLWCNKYKFIMGCGTGISA